MSSAAIDKFITEQIPAAVNTLATQLSVSAKDLWLILNRQVIANSLDSFIYALGTVIAAVILIRWASRNFKRLKERDDQGEYVIRYGVRRDNTLSWSYISYAIAGVVAFTGLLSLVSGIKMLYNPGYYALQMVLTELQRLGNVL